MNSLANENLIPFLRSSLVHSDNDECFPEIGLINAAILIPLVFQEDSWRLLFIHRSSSGEFHKGEVAFPGGSRENSDHDDVETAIRETKEELGITENHIQVIGKLPSASTITNFCVCPIVGVVKWPIELVLNNAEVERAFTIPLEWLMQADHWHYRDFLSPTRGVIKTIFYEPYDGEVLWGFSAKMTHQLIEIIKKRERR